MYYISAYCVYLCTGDSAKCENSLLRPFAKSYRPYLQSNTFTICPQFAKIFLMENMEPGLQRFDIA
jgi:hypothetical protein